MTNTQAKQVLRAKGMKLRTMTVDEATRWLTEHGYTEIGTFTMTNGNICRTWTREGGHATLSTF